MPQHILGRAERVSLPAYGLEDIPAKVDTGAYSASIDCQHAEVVEHDGAEHLRFILLHPGRAGYTGAIQETTDFERTQVVNANGVQDRFVIFADMIINDQQHARCRFTLGDRSNLRYPVLIGRRFISQARYLVDVTRGHGLPNDEEERKL